MSWLVADIGGTNSRFALCHAQDIAPQHYRKYPNAEFASLEAVIRHYLSEVDAAPTHACLAVAGPVLGDAIRLTNVDWHFSVAALEAALQLTELRIINDFTALAVAIPEVIKNPALLHQMGSGTPKERSPISVLGPGTGLGVSGLLWSPAGWVPIAGEGGHVGFTPGTEREVALLAYAQKKLGFVSAEHLISGNGLLFLHHALAEIDGRPPVDFTKPEEITQAALADQCGECRDTVMVFCEILGSFAGDHALMLGAFGGVYIGGGVAPQLEDLLLTSGFRARFEAKGDFTDYVRPIPTYCLRTHSQVALQGAALTLKQWSSHG